MEKEKDVLDELNKDLDSLQQEAIAKALADYFDKNKININQIDNTLKDYIMEQSGKSSGSGFEPKEYKAFNIALSTCGKPTVFPEQTDKIITDIISGNNVYLYGVAGTGKTYLAKAIAEEKLQREYSVITCSQWTSPITIIGGETIRGYRQGLLIDAWKKGKILILDELPKLDPNTAGLLNEALASTGDKIDACNIFYDGELNIGTQIYSKTISSDKKEGKKFVSGVYGIKDEKNENMFTYFWITKINDEYGVVTMIEEDGKFIEGEKSSIKRKFKSGDLVSKFPTVTDGAGIKHPKNPNFGCIGTGNTNMKVMDNTYGGNNRQDYSLVDRFSGSMYVIGFDKRMEDEMIYTEVLAICRSLRDFLEKEIGAVENISLRTMLNFNRIYEMQALKKCGSTLLKKFEIPLAKIKTLSDAVQSFVDTFNKPMLTKFNQTKILQESTLVLEDINIFALEFVRFKGLDPYTGDEAIIEIKKNKLGVDEQKIKIVKP